MSYHPVPFGFQAPYIPQGWGGQYYASSILSGFAYDIPQQILYTIYQQQQYDVFLEVPLSIAQQLTLAGKQNSSQPSFPSPDTIFTQQILTPHIAGVADIGTDSGINLVTDQAITKGFFPPSDTAYFPRCMLTENGASLLTESGSYLVL